MYAIRSYYVSLARYQPSMPGIIWSIIHDSTGVPDSAEDLSISRASRPSPVSITVKPSSTRYSDRISLAVELSSTRITSYNVCYTKLLRIRKKGGKLRMDGSGFSGFRCNREHIAYKADITAAGVRVITSYSIHYTKLYD